VENRPLALTVLGRISPELWLPAFDATCLNGFPFADAQVREPKPSTVSL